VRNVVDSCVCEHLNERVQTASLLQACIMVSDGLAHLHNAFTTGDMCNIARYWSVLTVLSSLSLCTTCTTDIINNNNYTCLLVKLTHLLTTCL